MRSVERNDALLLAGMAGGALIAAFGLAGGGNPPAASAPRDVAAIVGDARILRSNLENAAALVERDRRGPLTPEEHAQILDRMIDEELLFQRGMELGVARSDRRLRNEVVAAVIDAASQQPGVEPTTEELQAFFAANGALFGGPPALRVEQIFVASAPRTATEAEARATAAAARLRAGESTETVRAELGDAPPVEIPASLVPADRLRDSIGPAAAAAALALEEGGVTGVLADPDGYRVLVVRERVAAAEARFEDVRDDVRAELVRRSSENALREYVARLRAGSDVRVLAGTDGRP